MIKVVNSLWIGEELLPLQLISINSFLAKGFKYNIYLYDEVKNIPSGATIQIMTITGIMIKNIRLESAESRYLWYGRNDRGELVGTAVYLVAAHHPTEPNMVSKIAVIRK